jgi:hypothetical protein
MRNGRSKKAEIFLHAIEVLIATLSDALMELQLGMAFYRELPAEANSVGPQ